MLLHVYKSPIEGGFLGVISLNIRPLKTIHLSTTKILIPTYQFSLTTSISIDASNLLSAAPPVLLANAGLKRAKTVGPVCRKCGIIKQSGKLSCCARGGAWFKKCGDAGDSNFEHTWVEGIQACKGKSPRVLILLITCIMV